MLPITSTLDVLVIGAGQAGLAMGYQLKQHGLRFLIVDRHDRVGESWRQRYDSLVLFTPRGYCALPGLPLPGDPEGYPTKDEIADYLESYARQFDLPIAPDTEIAGLEHLNGEFRATTRTGRVIPARAVVLATGAFQQPAIPSIASQFAADVAQLTPETYRNPRQISSGTVLVVGDGATGRQIARELSESHRVLLAVGRSRRVSPQRMLGKSLFWWMDKLGVSRLSRDSAVGRYLIRTDPFPGKHLELDRLRKLGVTVVGRLTEVSGRRASFATGDAAEIDVVVWATGYSDRTDWVAIPGAVDARGAFAQRRGVSAVPGLYFVGRSWQWTRGSALLSGVGADAAYVAELVVGALDQASDARTPVEARETVAVGTAAPSGSSRSGSDRSDRTVTGSPASVPARN